MPQVPRHVQEGDVLAEDRREAAVLQVSLSNYVATAALAVLVGAAGIFTYVSQTFEPGCAFYVSITCTALALVASIFIGGKGTGIVIKQIATRTWSPDERNGRYATQATLTLVGLGLLLVSTAFGVTAPRQQSSLEERVENLAREVASLAVTKDKQRTGRERLWLEHLIATADYRIDRLESQIQNTPDEDGQTGLRGHLMRQRAVQSRQCRALAALIDESRSPENIGICRSSFAE